MKLVKTTYQKKDGTNGVGFKLEYVSPYSDKLSYVLLKFPTKKDYAKCCSYYETYKFEEHDLKILIMPIGFIKDNVNYTGLSIRLIDYPHIANTIFNIDLSDLDLRRVLRSYDVLVGEKVRA